MQIAESAKRGGACWKLLQIRNLGSGEMAKSHRGGRDDVQLFAGANWHLEGQQSLQILSKVTGLTEEEDDCVNRRRVHAWRNREHRKLFSCAGSAA